MTRNVVIFNIAKEFKPTCLKDTKEGDKEIYTHAVSDYHGVININREDIPQRNVKICTLFNKQTLHPQ